MIFEMKKALFKLANNLLGRKIIVWREKNNNLIY